MQTETLWADSLHNMGRVTEAIATFKKALKRDPTCPCALYRLGMLYLKEAPGKSAEWFERAIETNTWEPALYTYID